MNTSETKESKGIISSFLNFPLMRRIKIVKELVLEKMDLILSQISLVFSQIDFVKELAINQFNSILSRIDQLDHKTNTLLENDTPLLKAALHLIQSLQSSQQENLQHLTTIDKTLQPLQHIGELVEKKTNNLQLESQQHHQSLSGAVDNLQLESQQHHQSLSGAVDNLQLESQQHHQSLSGAVDNLQLESQQHHQSLSGAVDNLQLESQQHHQSLSGAVDNLQLESQQHHQSLSGAVDNLQLESQQHHQSLSGAVDNLQLESQQHHQSLFNIVQQALGSIHTLTQEVEKIFLEQSKNKIIIESSQNFDVETGLMAYLYSYLPSPYAIDIGANVGDVSESLLKTGYEVYAFEPFPPVFEKLNHRLQHYPNFHGFSFAVGAVNETSNLNIAIDTTETNSYGDFSLYNSLIKHSMPKGLIFTNTIPVTVRTLESLHNSREIPSDISLVKIDTEGFDLEVIRGMGDYRYPVVIAEFWDSNVPFGESETFNKLEDMVKEMRQRQYHWYIVIYRVWGSEDISFYCNYPYSVEKSWGNIFFFQDHSIFSQALTWCSTILAMTYFKN